MKKLVMAMVFLFPVFVLAQAVSPSPAPVVAAPSVWDSIVAWLSAHSGTISTVGSFLVTEVAMRAWPTKNPMSWLLLASKVVKGLGAVLASLSGILDGIVGQNTSS